MVAPPARPMATILTRSWWPELSTKTRSAEGTTSWSCVIHSSTTWNQRKAITELNAKKHMTNVKTRNRGLELSRNTFSWTQTSGHSAGRQAVSPHHRGPTTAVLVPTKCSPEIWSKRTTGKLHLPSKHNLSIYLPLTIPLTEENFLVQMLPFRWRADLRHKRRGDAFSMGVPGWTFSRCDGRRRPVGGSVYLAPTRRGVWSHRHI